MLCIIAFTIQQNQPIGLEDRDMGVCLVRDFLKTKLLVDPNKTRT